MDSFSVFLNYHLKHFDCNILKLTYIIELINLHNYLLNLYYLFIIYIIIYLFFIYLLNVANHYNILLKLTDIFFYSLIILGKIINFFIPE